MKNGKITIEKLARMVAIGLQDIAEIKKEMATDDHLKELRFELADVERRLTAKIDSVDEKLDALEEADVRNIQQRVYVLEKAIKQLKRKHV